MAASLIFGMPVFYLVLLQLAKCSNKRSQSSSKFSKIKDVEARGSGLNKDSKIDQDKILNKLLIEQKEEEFQYQ